MSDIGWRTTVENINEPAGETHTLEPLPRPATWIVAVAVKPVGRRRSSWVFLNLVNDLVMPCLYRSCTSLVKY